MHHPRTIQTDILQWQGITLEITYEPEWLGIRRHGEWAVAHLGVTSVAPERAPLPITGTGYRSCFLHPDLIHEAGGAVAFVEAWLEDQAKSREWQAHLQSSQQLSLF